MADNRYIQAIEAIRVGIKSIISDMEIADKEITKIANSASKIGNAFKINTSDGLNNTLKEQTYLLKLLSEQISKQTTNTNNLADAKRQLITLTGQEKINNRQLAKNADLYAQSTSKLVGAYGNLIAKQKMAKKVLQDAISVEKQNIAQIKRAQVEYDKLSARVNQANKATSNFSKNGLGKMASGFRNLLGAFGISTGIYLFAELAKNVFELTKKMQSLDFSLKAVLSSQRDQIRTQEFLSDITKRYGADIITTTERYIKFVAAAQQSNLSLEKTEQIFSSVTKASGVLGLKTDELTGIYLALEQMLSKGKVTTEELRRQLGERLPGAFGIMAKAIGVNVSQLDEMLRKGEIISSETLPKFAAQLEKAYGIENVNNIETIVAAQTRLNNSWVEYVKILSGDRGGTAVIYILDEIAKSIENTTDRTDTLLFTFEKGLSATDRLKVSLNAISKSFKSMIPFLDESTGAFEDSIQKLKDDTKERKINADEIANQIKMFVALNDTLRPFENGQNEQEKDAPFSLYKDMTRSKEIVENELKVQKQLLQESTAQQSSAILDRIDILNKELEAWERNTKAKKQAVTALSGSLDFIKNQISALEKERQSVATNSNTYHGYTMAIDALKEKLFELQGAFEMMGQKNGKVEITIDTESFNFESALKSFQDAFAKSEIQLELELSASDSFEEFKNAHEEKLEKLRQERLDKELERIATTKAAVSDLFNTFSDFYDIDLSNFEFLYDGKKNTIMDYTIAAKDLAGSALDASLQKYEIELQEAQRANELIQNNELATEKEKRLARQQFELEERRIKTERAKKERQNTLIKIAIDTASAIAASLAPPPLGYGPLVGLATIPIIGGIGLAQAALVASQPLPKFAEGTKSPLTNDTNAIVGDGYRQEAITENGKLIGITPNTPTVIKLKKGQEVQKDAQSWINNAIYRMNMESNVELLSSVMMDNIMHDELRKMRSESSRTWKEVKKLANRPVNVNNKVVVEQKYTKYNQ